METDRQAALGKVSYRRLQDRKNSRVRRFRRQDCGRPSVVAGGSMNVRFRETAISAQGRGCVKALEGRVLKGSQTIPEALIDDPGAI